jgi:hypothetical protein
LLHDLVVHRRLDRREVLQEDHPWALSPYASGLPSRGILFARAIAATTERYPRRPARFDARLHQNRKGRRAKLVSGAAMCAAQSRASLGPNRVNTGNHRRARTRSALPRLPDIADAHRHAFVPTADLML